MLDIQSAQSAPRVFRLRIFLFVFFWCFSFAIGIVFARITQNTSVALIRTASLCRVSFWGLIASSFLPLLITVIAMRFSVPDLIYPLLILKGLSSGYCIFGFLLTFGTASWLVYFLSAFTETLMIVPTLWLWILVFSRNKTVLRFSLTICFLGSLLTCLINYWVISPFLVSLKF